MLGESFSAPRKEAMVSSPTEQPQLEAAAVFAKNIREARDAIHALESQTKQPEHNGDAKELERIRAELETKKKELEGSESIMAEEIAKKRPQVLGMCRKLIRTRGKTTDPEALAQDMAQEVMIKAIRFAGSFKGEAKLTSWLGTITRNTIASYFRNRGSDPKNNVDIEDAAHELAGRDNEEENLISA